MKPYDNRAWLLMLPALAVLGVVGALPLLTVINYGFHDIFALDRIHWIGPQWYADIVRAPEFAASFARSLLFSALALTVQVPLGVAIALGLTGLGRGAVWGLMLCALPLVVPWNMIPMMWLSLIGDGGLLGPALDAIGFDYKFT
ncbi:MAG: sugar ABC transporter permease, partial [Paracoccaceae bacterium]